MERPYKGRAIIQDNITDLQIIIPAKRNWFIILFIGAWLGGWLFGEIFALGSVAGFFIGRSPAGLFILFWLIGWTVGGFFAFRMFLWNLSGKEIITIGQDRLTIDKSGALLFKAKIYDLNEVKNIRAQDDNLGGGGPFGVRSSGFGVFNTGGTIRFDYGLQTVKFAGGIDEAEAKFILDKLRERHLLTDKNYG
jgi:hypothetical protein